MMVFVAFAILAAAAWFLGRAVLRYLAWRPASRLYADLLHLLAGLLLIHLVLSVLQVLHLPWTRLSVALALLVVAGGLLGCSTAPWNASRTASSGDSRPSLDWGWGDAVAAVAIAGFAVAALTLRSTHPDFIFHWGIKAKKFVLAGGVDYAYLSHAWNHFIHPDYPNLLPELYTLTALFGGSFREPALFGWSVLFFIGLVLAGREALRRGRVSPSLRQASTAALALGAAGFSIGYFQAGGADLMLALALLAALPPLLEAGSQENDLAVGVAAAFAAASKIEGVVLAVVLTGCYLAVRRWRCWTAGTLTRVLLPPAVIIVHWAGSCLRYGLFQPSNLGPLDLGRWDVVLPALTESLAQPQWHGMPYLLVLLPLLVFARVSRTVAAVVLLQLCFYLVVYFTTPVNAAVLIRLSFPRLLFHLLPALFVAALLAVSRPDAAASSRSTPRRHTSDRVAGA